MHTFFNKLSALAIKNAFLVLHSLRTGNDGDLAFSGGFTILPLYQSFLTASLDEFRAQNWLNQDLSLTASGKALLANASSQQIQKELSELAFSNPELKSYALLLAACTSHLAPILKGHTPALEILFVDETLLPSIYGNNPIADTLHDAMKTLFREALPNHQLDILEVGAGTGSTTRALLTELAKHTNWKYTFSDISPHFTHIAKSSGHFTPDHFSFCTLNLNNPTDLQQKCKTYDVIIGTNVLHACSDVKEVLKTLKAFLKPSGRFIFGEITRVEAYLTYTFGLLEDWWQKSPQNLRLKNSPLLSEESWRTCCKELGLHNFSSITPANTPWQTAFCASAVAATNKVTELKKIIAELLVKPLSEIDENKTFAQLGVDSLLVLTFTGKIHQHFKFKVRAADIFDFPTIAKLAAHLETAHFENKSLPQPAQEQTPQLTAIEKTYKLHELMPYMHEHKKNNKALMPIDGWLKLILEAFPKEQQAPIAICQLRLLSPFFETEDDVRLVLTLTPKHSSVNDYLGEIYSTKNNTKTVHVEFETKTSIKMEQTVLKVEQYPDIVSAEDLFTTKTMYIGQSYRIVEHVAYSPTGFICHFVQQQSISLYAYLHGLITCALKFARTGDLYLPSFVNRITLSANNIHHAIGILKSKHQNNYTFDLHLCSEDNTPLCTLEDFTIECTSAKKPQPDNINTSPDDEIAIVGMSGVFGKAANLDEFWKVLENSECIVCDVPEKRKREFNDKAHLKAGFISAIDTFDHEFFQISRQEAAHMDPQQRLLLEQSYRAFEDAGYTKAHLEKMKDSCGVFVGASDGDYLHYLFSTNKDLAPQTFWGNAPSVLSGRLSYYFDFHGPSITVDTACSSSLVALHLACQSIRMGECKSALVGGVFLLTTDLFHTFAGQAQMLSDDGLCHTFDLNANGFVPGEAVVTIVLKPLKEAIKHKDKIYGTIKATGVNHDGRTNTLTSPSAKAQESLLYNTYKTHKISPADISYVEAHGTGTVLGDPIEIEGLSRAYLSLSPPTKCAIGSVKTTLGHTAAAAGLVGFAKILLALKEQKLPASLHFHKTNSEIDFDNYGFYVVDHLQNWPKTQKPRLAAISSFGFSGTNAHVVVSESHYVARSIKSASKTATWPIFLSGHTPEILLQKASELLSFLTTHLNTYSVESISYTLACRRNHFYYRCAFSAATIQEICDHLLAITKNSTNPISASTSWDALISEYLTADDSFTVPDGLFLEKTLAPLPHHPFQKISHWITTTAKQISLPKWLFEEHAVGDELSHLLPGMALVALMHEQQQHLPLHLCNFVWKKMVLPSDQPLSLGASGTNRFVLKNASSQDVAEATFEPFEGSLASPTLADLLQQVEDTSSGAAFYEECKKAGFYYGPRFQGIKNISILKRNATIALYEVPDDFGTSWYNNALLFDICLQPLLSLHFDSAIVWLPHSFDSFTIIQTPSNSGYCYIKKEKNTFDVYMYSIEGTLWGKLTGVHLEASPIQKSKPKPIAPSSKAAKELLSQLKTIFGDVLQEDPARLRHDVPFLTLGIDSSIMLTLLHTIETTLQTAALPKTLLYEYSTLESLAEYFASTSTPALIVPQNSNTEEEPIAIIGVYGQFGPCRDLESYWNTLKHGVDCITPPSQKRLNLWGITADQAKGYVGSWIEDVDLFEPRMYRISPKDAESMDPQERIFLDCVQGLLETASYTPQALSHSNKVGVFVGAMYGHYELYGQQALSENSRIPNSSFATIANRVSYVMNWQGPSMAVDTMCSSSLTAIHLACMSIRGGQCEAAVAGGVNIHSHSQKYDWLRSSHFLSEDGRCRSFGQKPESQTDGYVPGEGVGALLLKPLSKAEKDGDFIWGVILGSAANHGGTANGYTVPSPKAQQNVIQDALDYSGIDKSAISYIEAHGTGTALGDPIEIRALEEVFENVQHTIHIGSVKSNIGHLEAAAGIAGITKVLLQMQHKTLVPSLHSTSLNPYINFSKNNLEVQQQYKIWMPQENTPRIAGVSAFGAGGSNAHVVVQEYINEKNWAKHPRLNSAANLLLWSSHTPRDLLTTLKNVYTWWQKEATTDISSISYNLFQRKPAPYRVAVIVSNAKEMEDFLQTAIALLEKNPDSGIDQLKALPGVETGIVSYETALAVNDDVEESLPYEALLKKTALLFTKGDHYPNPWKSQDLLYKKPMPRSHTTGEAYWVEYKKKTNAYSQALIENISTIDDICFKINKPLTSKHELLSIVKMAAMLYNPKSLSIESKDHVTSDNPLTADGEFKVYFQQLDNSLYIYEVAQEIGTSSIIHAQGHFAFNYTTKHPLRIATQSWKPYFTIAESSSVTPTLVLTEKPYISYPTVHNTNPYSANSKEEIKKFKPETLDILDISDIISSDNTHIDWDVLYRKIEFLKELLVYADGKQVRIIQEFSPNNLQGSLFKTLYSTLSAEYKNVQVLCLETTVQVPIDFSTFETLSKQTSLLFQNRSFYEEVLQDVEQTSSSPPNLSEGTYIFVGGFGQIGQTVIDYAIKRRVKSMHIVGSKKFEELHADEREGRLAKMNEWQKQGINVHYSSVNIAHQESVREYIAAIQSPIAGVFFLAGRQSSGAFSFIKKNYKDWKEVTDPKIQGLYHFYEVLKNNDSLKFIIAFSSVSAVIPELAVGLTDYSFANSYMDMLSKIDQENGTKKLFSIQWPAWENTTMGNQANRSSFFGKIQIQQAYTILDAVVTNRPTATWCILPEGNTSAPALDTHNHKTAHEPLLKKLEALFRNELKLKSSHTLFYDTHFTDIGVDSILIADLLKKLESEFSIPIPPTALLDNPTLRKLAQHLGSLLEIPAKRP